MVIMSSIFLGCENNSDLEPSDIPEGSLSFKLNGERIVFSSMQGIISKDTLADTIVEVISLIGDLENSQISIKVHSDYEIHGGNYGFSDEGNSHLSSYSSIDYTIFENEEYPSITYFTTDDHELAGWVTIIEFDRDLRTISGIINGTINNEILYSGGATVSTLPNTIKNSVFHKVSF